MGWTPYATPAFPTDDRSEVHVAEEAKKSVCQVCGTEIWPGHGYQVPLAISDFTGQSAAVHRHKCHDLWNQLLINAGYYERRLFFPVKQ